MSSTILNISTSATLPSIWNGGTGTTLNYGRFVGFARNGWDIYDSTFGLPAPRILTGDYKTPTVLGFGVGGGYSADLRTGVNLDLKATTGSARLNLNDQITFSWTQDAANFYLNSTYLKNNTSSLSVTGPNATLKVDGRFDVGADIYLQGKTPLTSWSRFASRSFSNRSPLFSRTFNSTGRASVDLFNGAVSLAYQGINLDTTAANNTQLANGVISRIKDPVIGASLDLDAAVGRFLGLPSGLTLSASATIWPLKARGSLILADARLNYAGSVDQTLQATIDAITGSLNIEGKPLRYTVGTSATLPKATYDSNKDGKLNISGTFSKQGRVTNRTDIVNDLSGRVTALAGDASATATVPDPTWWNPFRIREATIFSGGFGPLYDSGNIGIASRSINAFNNTWNANLGTTSSLGFTLA
jgi:hypothetical protein